MDVSVEVLGSRDLLSGEGLQLVSRVCRLLCVGRWVVICLTGHKPFSQRRQVLYI